MNSTIIATTAQGSADATTDALSFWGAVGLAAAIATALATAASTIVAIWWRYQDRQEAEFVLHVEQRGGMTAYGNRAAAPKIEVKAQNVGDGAAHKVRVTGHLLANDPFVGGERFASGGWSELRQPIPILRTGDHFLASISAESFDVWDRAYVEVSWWPPPTRKTKQWLFWSREQRQQFVLSDLTEVPSDLESAPDGEDVY